MDWPYLAFFGALFFIALIAIAAQVGRWNRQHRFETFASTEPDRDRELTEEFHFELEDIHGPNDHPRTPH